MAPTIAQAVHLLLLACTFAARASSQTTTSTGSAASTMTTATAPVAPSSSGVTVLPSTVRGSAVVVSSATPSYSCSASDTNQNGCSNTPDTDTGLTQYYFVFLALIICVAGLGAFLVWRKKKRARQWALTGRQNALAHDISAWEPDRQRRRYWQGRRRSAQLSQEEGLNEHGEAPPPYVPKNTEEEQARQTRNDGGEPAIPLQTLSREDAGLKPPDYTETHTRPVSGATAASNAGASREPDERRDA